jgi:hypothetical protein
MLEQTPRQVHRYHWLAFWRQLAFISLLVVAGVAALLAEPYVGLALLAVAVVASGALYLHWSWTCFTFTDNNRLIHRHGIMGSSADVIWLFGIAQTCRIPIVGRVLDVGSVVLSVPGPDLHIRHIAQFEAFFAQLAGVAQQRMGPYGQSPVQVLIQLPPAQRIGGNGQVPQYLREPGQAVIDPDAIILPEGLEDEFEDERHYKGR